MAEIPVLVVGGCGFVGYHVTKALLAEKSPKFSVHVLSRKPSYNLLPGAKYHAGDFTSETSLTPILSSIKAVVILHVASPQATGQADESIYYTSNVLGTETLLRVAAKCTSVQAFIYTSSSGVLRGDSYDMGSETWPLKTAKHLKSNAYAASKAIADQRVRDLNGEDLLTCCLRVCAVYGERDSQMIPGSMKLLRAGRHKMQIGDNTARSDHTSGENVALAHVLAAKALLAKAENPKADRPKIDGEAFFITDGKPMPTWDFARLIWRAAGDRTRPEEIRVIPAWLMLGIASLVEWCYWIFSLGTKRPLTFRRSILATVCVERTFCIEKARGRLGYVPLDNMEDAIKRGVAYWEKEEAEDEVRKKKGSKKDI